MNPNEEKPGKSAPKDPNRVSLRFQELKTKQAYEELAARSNGHFSLNQLMEMAAQLAYEEVARRVETFKRGFSLGRAV